MWYRRRYFLKHGRAMRVQRRAPDSRRYRHAGQMRRLRPGHPILSPSRVIRGASGDGTGAPFEDLRRRLATINASGSSLNLVNTPRDGRALLSPAANSSTTSLSAPNATLGQPDRPPSPTESIVSTHELSRIPLYDTAAGRQYRWPKGSTRNWLVEGQCNWVARSSL